MLIESVSAGREASVANGTSSGSGGDADAAALQRRYERLLAFASDSLNPVRVAVRDLPGSGRGLAVTSDVQPGEVLLSVPLTRVFKSQPYEELTMHWAAEMGLRLLQARHASRQHGNSSSSNGDPQDWGPWINVLPERVVTPLEFSEELVHSCAVPSTIRDIINTQESLADCFDELAPQLEAIGCGWEDLLWAVQVLHSRCFFETGLGLHLSVPGVDMANDAGDAANATVRLLHSPGACQGAAATEEIAPPLEEGSGGGDSVFQLIAGEDGIAEGEEVTISYGPFPSEPLFMLFGFLRDPNPRDNVVIYCDLEDAARHYCECCNKQLNSGFASGAEGASGLRSVEGSGAGGSGIGMLEPDAVAARAVAMAEERIADDDGQSGGQSGGASRFDRLVVSPDGLDSRMGEALRLVRAAADSEAEASGRHAAGGAVGAGSGGQAAGAPGAGLRLSAVVVDRLMALQAALIEAENRFSSGGLDSSSSGSSSGGTSKGGDCQQTEDSPEALALAASYRHAKLRVVEAALAAMTGGGAPAAGR